MINFSGGRGGVFPRPLFPPRPPEARRFGHEPPSKNFKEINMITKTKILIGTLTVVILAVGGWWIWESVQRGCNTDEDCKSLSCPPRYELGCTSVQFPVGRCVNHKCVCRCKISEYNLPKAPSGEELIYEGKTYIKTDETYSEYIPDKFRVDLEDGTSIYILNNSIYTLSAADPHHGSYIYVKWIEKTSPPITTDKTEIEVEIQPNNPYTLADGETQIILGKGGFLNNIIGRPKITIENEKLDIIPTTLIANKGYILIFLRLMTARPIAKCRETWGL